MQFFLLWRDRKTLKSSGEHIGISQVTFKKTKPSKESSIHDHLLQCDNNPSFDEFTILAHGNKKYLLEIKESILIKRNQPVLNKNIGKGVFNALKSNLPSNSSSLGFT